MLTKLILRNWQCHHSTEIELVQVTVLVGDNDVGKTSILRALKWLALNQWDGRADEHITWEQMVSEVTAVIDDRWISRVKGGGKNVYILDGEELMAGKDVPPPVARVLKLSETSFQDQHDPAYWLMLNPPGAAGALNDLFNLSQIDDTASRIASELRQAQATVKVTEARQQAAGAQERALAWTSGAHQALTELESTVQKINSLDQMLPGLRQDLAEIKESEEIETRSNEVIRLGTAAIRLGERIAALHHEASNLQQIVTEEALLCQQQNQLKQKEAQLRKLLAGKCPLCQRTS
jgi:hypothetical protein